MTPSGGSRSLFHHTHVQPGLRSLELSPKAAQISPEGNQDGKDRIGVFSLRKRLTNTLEQVQWRLGLKVKEMLVTTLKKNRSLYFTHNIFSQVLTRGKNCSAGSHYLWITPFHQPFHHLHLESRCFLEGFGAPSATQSEGLFWHLPHPAAKIKSFGSKSL